MKYDTLMLHDIVKLDLAMYHFHNSDSSWINILNPPY